MGGGDEVEVFLVGKFVLVAEAAVAGVVAEVGTAEVSADAAGIVAEACEDVGVPVAAVAGDGLTGEGVLVRHVFGTVGP